MISSSRRVSVAPFVSAAALLGAAVLAGAVLRAFEPHLSGSPSAWRGDDLAFAATWAVAAVCTIWLALTTFACLVAVARGELAGAARIAACAPPFARRLLQTALVGALVLTPTAAHAAVSPAPLTLRVDTNGRLTEPPVTAVPGEVPVVRAPATTTTTTAPAPTTTTAPAPAPKPPTTPVPDTTTTTSPRVAPHRPPTPTHTPAPPTAPRAAARRHYVVRAGDNLWSIAAREVTRRLGASPTDTAIANYWQRVVAANRTTLRSGDPSLIFPDEIVTLPLD